jgi:hypothetical protein
MLYRPALHVNWNALSFARGVLKYNFPTLTVQLATVLQNRQVFLPDPVYHLHLYKGYKCFLFNSEILFFSFYSRVLETEFISFPSKIYYLFFMCLRHKICFVQPKLQYLLFMCIFSEHFSSQKNQQFYVGTAIWSTFKGVQYEWPISTKLDNIHKFNLNLTVSNFMKILSVLV